MYGRCFSSTNLPGCRQVTQPSTPYFRHALRCLCPKKANEADLQGVQIEQNTDTSTTFSFSETEPRELIRVPNHNLENATREYASQQSSLPRSSDAQEAALAGAGQPSVTSDHSLTTLETSPALHSSHPQQQQLHRRANDAGSAEQLQEAGGRQARDVAEEGRHKGGVGEHKSRQNKAKSVAEKVPRVRPEAPGKVHGSASSNENEARAKLERTWSAQSHGEAPSFSGRASPPSSKKSGVRGRQTVKEILAAVDEVNDADLTLWQAYSGLCSREELEAALTLLSRLAKAKRKTALRGMMQKHFLGKAASLRSAMSVKQAFKFLEILPREFTNLQTYNMVVTVCIHARDMAAALQAADILRSTGRKPDAVLYNNLIKACAVVGDADAAFRLHSEMVREGCPLDKHSATSLVDACSQELLRTSASQRRQRLVLLERAGNVLSDFRKKHSGQMDQALWNAFITAAGRASQMGRAVETLEEMQKTKLKPDGSTYGAMLDACVRNGEKSLALKMYRRALDAGITHNQHIYTGTIAACIPDRDKDTALRIFNEMLRNEVVPDDKLYSVLVSAVGAADPAAVLTMQDHLLKQKVVKPQAILSSMIGVFLESKDLDTAMRLFREAQESDIHLSDHTVNAMLNAIAKTGDLEKVVKTVTTLAKKGFEADKYTYTAILNACQRADAGELAFTIWRLMQHHDIVVDEAIALILIRTCYNQIQLSHVPYHPDEETRHEQEKSIGIHLCQVLSGPDPLPRATTQEERLPWGSRALSIYQKLVATGVKPRLHVLERLFACLRLWNVPEKRTYSTNFGAELKMREYLLPDGRKSATPQHSTDGLYDKRAFSVLEEAMGIGCLPSFKPGSEGFIELRGIPPAIAEVLVLKVLAAVAESQSRRLEMARIAFKTQPFRAWVAGNERRGPTKLDSSVPLNEERRSCSLTGLAVTKLLRRLDLLTTGKPEFGEIVLSAEVLVRWKRLAEKAASNMEMASLNSVLKASRLRTSINDQTMRIRMGMDDDH